MRVSKLFGKTSKTEGTDYVIPSHRLLTQAGYIRESTAGRYYLLPLGLKVHDNIIKIVRKHMDAADAQELLMPVLHPLELWKETNRTNTTGFELMKIKDRRDAEFALGGTAEEMAVDLVRKFNISYRDLPFNIYQFAMKFRDEARARGGLLRVREFVMKDAYSFSTEQQFKDIYQKMWDAYAAICTEIGLEFDVVAADNGYIGGEYCHEFIAYGDNGESRYFVSQDGSYTAHEDIATFKKYQEETHEEPKPMQEVEGKGMIGVEQLAKFLDIPVQKTTKTILFETITGEVVAAAVMGEYDINETKLRHILGGVDFALASPETVKRVTGAAVGYAGFLNLPKAVRVILDESVRGRSNFEVGANHTNFHTINVNFGRDYPEPEQFYDIALAKAGYETVDGNGKLSEKRGFEVGNIFQLGYHYTNLMSNAQYTDGAGKSQKYYMGCYGFGIGRSMAAVVEAHHDDRGIIWPENIAPFRVYLASLGNNPAVILDTDRLYEHLQAQNISVIYDDRDVRPGQKFADADLLGIPYRLVVSEKTLKNNIYELKRRTDRDSQLMSADEIIKTLAA